MLKKFTQIFRNSKQVLAYLFWGVMTTLINLTIFQLLVVKVPKLNYEFSNGIAWLVSALFAYLTNRKWVFHSITRGKFARLRELVSFMAGRLGSLIIEDLILWIGITQLSFNDTIGKAGTKIVGEIFVIVFNYFWSELAVFKKSTESKD